MIGAIIAALGVGTANVVLAVGIFSIPGFARVSRGSTLSVEGQDFVLAGGRDFITNAPQLVLYPGITIFIVAMCFNLVGDGLRDALDPYLRRARA